MANQIQARLQANCKRKGVQFSNLYEVLNHGHPMIDYERSESLLKFLRVKNMPPNYWTESTSWEITGHLHLIVLKRFREVVQFAMIISINVDDVIAYIYIYIYI